MSQFQLPTATPSEVSPSSTPVHRYSSDDAYSDDDDLDTLPYPTELPRNDFLQPSFNPQTYLSTLRNRHQTLEDLRSDLRQRSQLLNRELLELVNGNYEEFLSLGGDLRGGEERVEGVRVGVLGFQREVEGIRKAVGERREEVGGLMGEKKRVRGEVVLGRALLEVYERLGEVESSLGMTDAEDEELEDEDEDEDDAEDGSLNGIPTTIPVRKLQRQAQQYVLIQRMVERIGTQHPFLVKQRGRLEEVRKTMLLDLAAALRQARTAKSPEAVLAVVKVYADLDAEAESVKVLRGG